MIKNLLYFSIITTIVIISWISFGVYHSFTASTIAHDTSILITPIPGRFDDATIRRITTRHVIQADLSQKKLGTPSATPTLTPAASGGKTNVATGAAGL
jgi:hypothetical protein